MPLVHKKSGWFWGSKGPFPSKAKALQVARAAYAHGYKEFSDASEKFFLTEGREKNYSGEQIAEKK